MLNGIADKKAEQNFNLILYVLRQQAIKKIYAEHIKKLRDEEMKTNGGGKVKMRELKAKIAANALPIDLSSAEQDVDNLITYKEFMASLKGAKDQLYYKILPRSLSFQ